MKRHRIVDVGECRTTSLLPETPRAPSRPSPDCAGISLQKDNARAETRRPRTSSTRLSFWAATVWLLAIQADVTADDGGASIAAESQTREYLLSTPQIPDPLKPLALAQRATGSIAVRSAVVTVADPLETHLGRAFDSQLAALIRAFHAKDYVLDGFAFTWSLSRALKLNRASAEEPSSSIPEDGTASFREEQRGRPSVLVFRKDLWRRNASPNASTAATANVEYFVVFLVGESPTFGIHPRAFEAATTCATRLAGNVDEDRLSKACDQERPDPHTDFAKLQVVGPTFSGTMTSMVVVLGRLLATTPGLEVDLQSPSATVESNQRIKQWIEQDSGVSDSVRYTQIALSLESQLRILANYAHPRFGKSRIVILAEESTFGHGVTALLKAAKSKTGNDEVWKSFVNQAQVVNFPQNISAIRAEHARIDNQKKQVLRNLLSAQSSLLELDLSHIEELTDRPPSYRGALSARSDELMLYGTFDALRVWVKPAIVVIVATDIRDRLFLLNELRKSLPTALPVLMEMDFLTAHPDYRKISRGSLVIPNGDTLLCLDNKESKLRHCPGTKAHKTQKSSNNQEGPLDISWLSFPSDYAANMFRAALSLIESDKSSTSFRRVDQDRPGSPSEELYLTTLAGFQTVDSDRSRLLVADGRLLMQRPIAGFLFLAGLLIIATALWLNVHGRIHLVMMSPLRHLNPFPGVREADFQATDDASEKSGPASPPAPRLHHWLPLVLLVFGAVVVASAGFRLNEILLYSNRDKTWHLAHGRDIWVLTALLLTYLSYATIAIWRLFLWRWRFKGHVDQLADKTAIVCESTGRPMPRRCGQFPPSVVAVSIAGGLLWASMRNLPSSVDSLWPAFLFGLTLLLLGIGFLVELWCESRRLAWLAQLLYPTADLPADSVATGTNASADSYKSSFWASPYELGALPQSPFNVYFRERDLAALLAYPDDDWRKQTRELIECKRPCRIEPGAEKRFRAWQERLVAEMRYGLVAIRSCAWAAILAPTAVLLGMNLYPPFNERLMTTSSVVLIFAAFALVMYVVIKLEQHPLLGRLFTQHGDRLSVGGVVSVLWGKLVAAAVILIPVLFPETLSNLYGLLQSIDSLK